MSLRCDRRTNAVAHVSRAAVALIWALAAVVGIGGVGLGSLAPWQAALVGVQALLAIGVLAAAEGVLRR